ncbi:hypothetical protein [Sodalis glossinidius]|uniref:hypothetical protein n=1 Tax=Sodalis glossinidius TaxID=63612 RepID=UPI000325FE98|nr:hypothetical protein [Sodalis glossinidius]
MMKIEKPPMTVVPFANANCNAWDFGNGNAWDFGNGNVVYDFLTADRMAKAQGKILAQHRHRRFSESH